jgi:hypothetical protein
VSPNPPLALGSPTVFGSSLALFFENGKVAVTWDPNLGRWQSPPRPTPEPTPIPKNLLGTEKATFWEDKDVEVFDPNGPPPRGLAETLGAQGGIFLRRAMLRELKLVPGGFELGFSFNKVNKYTDITGPNFSTREAFARYYGGNGVNKLFYLSLYNRGTTVQSPLTALKPGTIIDLPLWGGGPAIDPNSIEKRLTGKDPSPFLIREDWTISIWKPGNAPSW